MPKKVRMGMVGGGQGAFIGAVHRLAAGITGEIDLVAGAFSRDGDASRAFGAELGLSPERSYASYTEMFGAELALPEDIRMQCVSIVTPNDSHADIACSAMKAGFDVICDKPLAGVLEDALRIEEAVKETGADTSVMYVPAKFAKGAMLDAANSDIKLLVAITEGIPTLDVLEAYEALSAKGIRLIGPNCPGLISPGKCKIGIMPADIHLQGKVGVISRSGTLTYEIVKELTDAARSIRFLTDYLEQHPEALLRGKAGSED